MFATLLNSPQRQLKKSLKIICGALFHLRLTGKAIFNAPKIIYTIIDRIKALTTGVKEMNISTIPAISLTDTAEGIIELIDSLGHSDLPTSPPSVYIDLEGINVGRKGSIAILQVYILPVKKTFLVDVHNLRERAFSTPNSSGLTLKAILESEFIPKVIFDVRNDSDALYSHFGVKLQGVIDLQLMELATRSHSQKFLSGLGRCMDQDLVQTPEELEFRSAIKKRGVQLFAPEKGGRYEVFNDRPLDPAIVDYCVQDVQLMPQLWNIYNAKLTLMDKRWTTKIERETKARLLLSQSPDFNGKGQHMAKAPPTW
ncbi:uncharacterized protein EAE97_006927 [Botrytis byssoidea]|uniref:3'-5' exonuclease domain-containing protein n=1 Tax=Botrytis byssoidea TaxID=139641 RepID=A0A9P5IQC4_9HELO|nr:uncharacterized protein EAE97_006927 [Botrytis byssoidea]KAF7940741.1 hypothetical protein EAE97_006927 [Botrytis byssoidea]